MIALLFACAREVPTCLEDYALQADGTCLREIPPAAWEGEATVEDVLAGLDPCVPESPSGRLDIDGSCADGACVGMTAAEFTSALGTEAVCEPGGGMFSTLWHEYYVDCSWPGALSSSFADADQDGVPDAGSPAESLQIDRPWDGTSADGLGVGSGFACFVDLYGEPDSLLVSAEGDVARVASVAWASPGISADWVPDAGPWDGTVDRVTLSLSE